MNSRRNFYHGSRKHTQGIPTWFITLPANCELCFIALWDNSVNLLLQFTQKHRTYCTVWRSTLYSPSVISYIYLSTKPQHKWERTICWCWLITWNSAKASKGQQRCDVSGAEVIICRWTLLAAITASNYCGNHLPPETCTPSTLRKIKSSAEGSHAASAQHGGI